MAKKKKKLNSYGATDRVIFHKQSEISTLSNRRLYEFF